MVIHEDSAVWALRWEAAGTTGGLFPVLDADITLTPAGDQASVLVMHGAYRPPLGHVGAKLNRAVMHRIAVPASTVQPIYGETKLVRFNLMTGERVEL